jgi:hypothetical protein
MSAASGFNACAYEEKLKRSIGPGMYMLRTPANDSEECGRDIPSDPSIRWQHWGPGFCEFGSAIDVSSELRGLNYKNTLCAAEQYYPGRPTPATKNACNAKGKQNPRDCTAPTEATRLSNPPCTLRGTGWNRWEWLCYDPQDKAVVPFDYLVSNRLMSKDNHKPCIPDLVDEAPIHPPQTSVNMESAFQAWKPPTDCGAAAPGNPNAVSWRTCEQLKKM